MAFYIHRQQGIRKSEVQYAPPVDAGQLLVAIMDKVECPFCHRMVSSDMLGVRYDRGAAYECCTMCCGIKK